MQVQFKTGQTEALLAVIIARNHSGWVPPSAALLSAKWLQRPHFIYWFKERKEVRNVMLMFTKPDVHSWEEWTPDNCMLIRPSTHAWEVWTP